MSKIKKIIYMLLKSIYYLLPKIIREQYSDSKVFYINLLRKINSRVTVVDNNLEIFKLESSLSCLELEFTTLNSITNRTSQLSGAILFDKTGKYTQLEGIEESVLDIKIYHFKFASVLGNTDALIDDYSIYHQELLAMEKHHDLKRGDIFTYVDRVDKSSIYIKKIGQKDLKDKDTLYISLLKEHSQNYYHWITEVIPKVVIVMQELSKNENLVISKDKHISFLIDEYLPKQCLEILKILVSFKYSLVVIKKGELCRCENLVYCSPFWQSLDNTSGKLQLKEFFVDKYGLELVRNALFSKLKLLKDKKPFRKIYLKRKATQLRSIINMNQVENFFIKNGFEMIETEKMTFAEQVKLFYETKLVIGASGATFTNLLFMQPETKAVIFYPSHPSANHGIFQPLADVSGVKFIHYKTIPVDEKSIHSNFMVDLSRIRIILEDDEG